jgi:hypothetical protein
MPDSDLLSGAESLSESHRVNPILQSIERASDRRFNSDKRSEHFIGVHNKASSVLAHRSHPAGNDLIIRFLFRCCAGTDYFF